MGYSANMNKVVNFIQVLNTIISKIYFVVDKEEYTGWWNKEDVNSRGYLKDASYS